jgi:hypothetical protein
VINAGLVTNAELARSYLDAVVERDYDHVESLLATTSGCEI